MPVALRDHRKMLVIDGTTGFTGGINLATPWLDPLDGGAGWRDDVIQVRGDATQELRSLFYRTWRKLTRESSPLDAAPVTWVSGTDATLMSKNLDALFVRGRFGGRVMDANAFSVMTDAQS